MKMKKLITCNGKHKIISDFKSCLLYLGAPIPQNFWPLSFLLKQFYLSKHLKKYEKLDFSAKTAKNLWLKWKSDHCAWCPQILIGFAEAFYNTFWYFWSMVALRNDFWAFLTILNSWYNIFIENTEKIRNFGTKN